MMPKGLFVGLTTIDIQYLINTFPTSNSKTVADNFAMSVGGPATNAAITFSYLSGKGHLLSVVGSNQFSSFIKSELQNLDVVHLDLLPETDQLPTISSIITTQRLGDRAVFTTSLPKFSIKDASIIRKQNEFNIVLVDGFNMKVCQTIAEQARHYGIPVVLDGGSWKEGMENLLPYIDIAICSENFHSPNGSNIHDVIEYLSSRGVSYSAITRGQRSIVYSYQAEISEIEIEPVEVVDTLGAGDILHGALCYYYSKDHDFVSALSNASRLATLSCRSFGTRSWMLK